MERRSTPKKFDENGFYQPVFYIYFSFSLSFLTSLQNDSFVIGNSVRKFFVHIAFSLFKWFLSEIFPVFLDLSLLIFGERNQLLLRFQNKGDKLQFFTSIMILLIRTFSPLKGGSHRPHPLPAYSSSYSQNESSWLSLYQSSSSTPLP